jgi:hypothetical protein
MEYFFPPADLHRDILFSLGVPKFWKLLKGKIQ